MHCQHSIFSQTVRTRVEVVQVIVTHPGNVWEMSGKHHNLGLAVRKSDPCVARDWDHGRASDCTSRHIVSPSRHPFTAIRFPLAKAISIEAISETLGTVGPAFACGVGESVPEISIG